MTEKYLSKSLHQTFTEKFSFWGGVKAAILSMTVNIVLAAVKITAGVMGNCYALVADGIESSVDILSSIVVWSGLRIASKPPDDNHPYGHWRAEPLAAVIVSLALFGSAVLIAVQSIREILTPHGAPASYTLVVLVVVVVVKEGFFRFLLGKSKQHSSSAIKTEAWHHRSDAFTSAAAFVGISIALIGGPGYESADDWAALAACAVIVFNGYHLFKEALDGVMDKAPPSDLVGEIRTIARSVPMVMAIDECRIRKVGPALFVDIHVIVHGDLTVRRGHEIAHDVKNALRDSNLGVFEVLVHVEPDSKH